MLLVLALAFIGSKFILAKAVHWAVPGGALVGVFDTIAEAFLIAAAIVIVCCGAFEVTWVVVKGTLEVTRGSSPKRARGDEGEN